MRKRIVLLAAVLLLLSFSTTAFAANTVTGAQAVASVATDGSCQVGITVTVHLDAPADKLHFPIPRAASAVSLNGSRVLAPRSGQVRRVNLSRIMGKVAGDFSFHIQYTLRDVIHTTQLGTQQLQLPLLSGFAYTIEAMDFTVTMPGAVEAKPAFTSGYHQSSIEADLQCTVEGMTITGTALKGLKDHETLTMLLEVSDQMFPRSIVETQTPTGAGIAMIVCAAVALLYWLLFLRYLPLRRQDATKAPEGFSAGTLGCALGLQGTDLSMLVLTWGQLGYLQLHRDPRGRVILYKRMDMGNERSEFEQRCFARLFGKRQQVDTTSLGYAQLHRSLSRQCAQVKELVQGRSGSPRIFRILASGIGLFAGVGIGLVLGSGAALKAFFVFLLGAAGGLSAYCIQGWAGSLLLHRRPSMVLGLVLSGLWLLLAAVAGVFYLGGWMVLGLLVGGLLLRNGGRRTSLGKQTAAQIRGLRRYMLLADTSELRRRMEADPEYFFRMLPDAMALGVDKVFARHFGGMRPGRCPYLSGSGNEGMSAQQWCALMRKTVDAMEDRANRLPTEKLLGILYSLVKR